MPTVTDVSARIDVLADQMTTNGYLTDQSWRPVLHAVPRHLFAPARAYATPGREGGPPERPIDRDADPGDWWTAVYDDMSIVTQRDDGAADPASDQGLPSCSLSAPSVVLPFLHLLGARPGDRVLEIGTGTGWIAGLLSEHIGQHHVNSVEIDPDLAATARENLASAGYAPTIIEADGLHGCPGETFDRLHVTCGITTIVTQYGHRRLWDELETAYRTWLTAGQPSEERFRLLVSQEGQYVVHDQASKPGLQPATQ